MLVGARAGWSVPAAPLDLANQSPAGGAETGPGLAGKCVRADAPEAERESGASCAAIQERAGVLGAIGAAARDFGRQSIVAIAGDRAPDDHHAAEAFALIGADGKDMASRWNMVTVMLQNEVCRSPEVQALMLEALHSAASRLCWLRAPVMPRRLERGG
jgi:hypothetical protein